MAEIAKVIDATDHDTGELRAMVGISYAAIWSKRPPTDGFRHRTTRSIRSYGGDYLNANFTTFAS